MGNLVFQATLGGQVNLVGPNTASTFNLNVPATSSTIATLTGTETFTNKTLTSPTLTTPVLGTPSSGTLTSCTGLPLTTGVTGTLAVTNGGTGVTTSTGSGAVVLATSPTITTPVISSLSSASATALTLQSAGTTAITVDTSQNVLVGTTSAQVSGAGRGNITINGTSSSVLSFGASNVNKAYIFCDGTNLDINNQANGYMTFDTNAAERMRITSAGELLIGTTSNINSGQLCVAGGIAMNSNSGTLIRGADTAGTTYGALSLGQSFGAGGLKDVTLILANNAGQRIYVQNRTAGVYLADGGTSWTSNSDERIKKNLVPIENALNKVSQLRAVIGEYIDDELARKRPFLIAQDVNNVLPEAVDKTNENVWGVQYTDVIPLLVASIKELKAINDTQAETINALTARVVARETK